MKFKIAYDAILDVVGRDFSRLICIQDLIFIVKFGAMQPTAYTTACYYRTSYENCQNMPH